MALPAEARRRWNLPDGDLMDLRLGFAALLIVFAAACSANKTSVSAVDDGIGSTQTTEQSIDEPVPSQTEPRTSSPDRSASGCLTDPQLWSFDPDVSTEINDQSGSLAEHIARSPLIVFGQLVQQLPYTTKGTGLLIKTGGAVGLQEYDRVRLEWIWVPGALSVSGILGDSFVAFLSGDEIQHSNRHTATAWMVQSEGLWIACEGEVFSVGMGPDGSTQAVQLDEPMALDELWSVVSASGLPKLDLWWHAE